MKEAKPTCRPTDHVHGATTFPAGEEAELERAAQLLRALGDAPRLRLLQLLASQERCVTELVETLQEKFPTVSQRLRLLRTEGLLRRRREGKHVYYALADRHVADLMENALAHARELESGQRNLLPRRKPNAMER
jgi:ArsR family transcriptional regulator